MNDPSKVANRHTVPVILGVAITLSVTACLKDLPTDPLNDKRAGAAQTDVVLQAIPINDDFDNAETVTTLPFTDAENTTEATTAPDDPVADCFFGTGPTVWYQFTPSADIRIDATTFGSDYDTGIAIYTGTRGSLAQIACNDEFEGSERVIFDAIGGETYFFMVGGGVAGSAGGNLVFNVQAGLQVDLTIDPSGSVNSKTGVPTIRGTFSCSRPAFVRLIGDLQQRAGRVFITGHFDRIFDCDGVTPWEAEADVSGLFTGGQVGVLVKGDFVDQTTFEEIFVQETATVNLKGKGK